MNNSKLTKENILFPQKWGKKPKAWFIRVVEDM